MSRQGKRFVILCMLLWAASNLAIAGTVGFQPAATYPVGQGPAAVAAADFNADGNIDLAVVDAGDGTVSILLGKGDGTFTPALNFSACQCIGLATGDFNSDNKSDLALLRYGDPNVGDNGDVTIFLSNGDGTFQKGLVLNPGNNPSSVIVQDVDADHKSDLIVSNATDVAILLGKGDGTFLTPVRYSAGAGLSSLLLVDFDQDGLQDLAVVHPQVTDILLANGDGTFRAGPIISTGFAFSIRAWADLNHDGDVDYVVDGCNAAGKCSAAVALGNGNGTFQTTPTSFSTVGAIFVADYDGDGKLDIAGTPHLIQGQADVLLGNGDGTFQAPVSVSVSSGVFLATVADLNNDKAPDLVTVNSNNAVSVLLNNATDFSISASDATLGTVSPGQSATSVVTVTLLNNFDNPVALACMVQPAGPGAPSCSLSANSVTPQPNGSATATLTINAGSTATSASWSAWLFAPVLAFVGLGALIPQRKGRLTRSVWGAILFAGLLLPIACGGGSGGHAAQTYTVTVTGSTAFAQHSTSLSVGVLTRSIARLSGWEEIPGTSTVKKLHRKRPPSRCASMGSCSEQPFQPLPTSTTSSMPPTDSLKDL